MLAPAGTCAVFKTAPTPVITEHPIKAAFLRSISSRIGIAHDAGTTEWEA